MRIAKSLVNSYISQLQSNCDLYLKNHKIWKAVNCLSAISFLKYKFYIGYNDDWIESRIQYAGKSIVKKEFAVKDYHSAIFVDSFSMDNRGLTQQYLDAMMEEGFSILYIHKNDLKEDSAIKNSILSYGKAILKQIPKSENSMAKSQWLYDTIIEFGAPRLFMHLMPNAIEECVAFNALPHEIVKYQLNLTDHTFWAGSSCMDYCFEFRQYGCNLSYEKRGFKKEKLFLLPFYPVMDENIPFEGFPHEAQDKFVFLTGGAPFKIIDENKTFFKLCKALLDKCPNAVILFAGTSSDDKILMDPIKEFDLQGRMIPIGSRRDIYNVFLHSNVFINTYPFGGGLMCQLAAHCSKPILNYKSLSIEEVVGQKRPVNFTSESIDQFVDKGYHYYSNTNYRNACGNVLNSAVVSKEEFNKAFSYSINNNKSYFDIQWTDDLVLEDLDEKGMYNFANNTWSVQYTLYKILGWDLFFLSPQMYIGLNIYRVFNKLRNKW